MKQAISHFENILQGISAGKANSNLLNGVKVEYYGSLTPIEHLASVSVANFRLLIIQPFDSEMLIKIKQAIEKSSLGITPQKIGQALHLPIPPLSGDRQEELVKYVKGLAEEQRVAIRNLRREFKTKDNQKVIDVLTKDSIAEIDAILEWKIDDLRGTKNRWKWLLLGLFRFRSSPKTSNLRPRKFKH